MLSWLLSPRLAAPLMLFGLVACTDEPAPPPAAGIPPASSVAASSLPVECENTSPFDSEACGLALQRACREATDEAACAGRELAGPDQRYQCAWARVVRFADVASCRVDAVERRCEAGLSPGDVPIGDPCDPSTKGGLYGTFGANVETGELIYVPGVDGPIGYGTARVNQQTETREVHACGADSPPPPAALCGCSEVACAAR